MNNKDLKVQIIKKYMKEGLEIIEENIDQNLKELQEKEFITITEEIITYIP